MKRLLSILLAITLLIGVLPLSVGAETTEQTYRGTAFTAGVNQNINFTQGSYDILTFDYILTTEGQIAIAIRSPGDVPYYGLYYFTADGAKSNYPGISCEKLDDGYIRVTCLLDGLFTTNSTNNRLNAPAVINKINIYRTSTASGYIDNVQVYDDPAMEGEHGAITTAGITARFPFDLADYDFISFEYKLVSNVEKGYICVRIPSSGDVPYYGLFYLYDDGGTYDGVTCEPLENGYYKVTIETDKVHRISNKDNNRAAVPASVKAVDIHSYSTANARIDNVQAYNQEIIRGEPTVAGTTSRFSLALKNYESISFEYKMVSDGQICVRIPSSGDVPYYGLFYLGANGGTYDGVTCEPLEDGYMKVTIELDKVNRTNNVNNRDNVPSAVKGVDIHYYSSGNAYIDNITAVERPVEHGDALIAGADWTNTTDAAAYQVVTVDYWITNDGQFAMQLLDAQGANYYGNYYFNADGEVQDYAGVTCEKRSDRYMKITFHVAELALNSGVAPTEIAAVKIVGSESTATGFVDNIQYKLTAVPTGIRVGVLSDVHINANDPEQTTRFEHALTALKLRGVDAVLISGDLQEHTGGVGAVDAIESYAASWYKIFPNNTNDLTGEHVEPIFIYGNHDKTLVADGYWPESLGSYEDAFIKEINGYYFVGAQYSRESEATRFIEYAKEDSNGYPFFYTQHCTLYDTLYGIKDENTGTSKTVLNNLKDASNAITFTGHTHTPATDERSIWQSTDANDPDFTAVLVPSINYSYLGDLGLGKETYPLGQMGMYMVVEGSDVTITRLSFADPTDADGMQIGENWSFDAADPNDRPYDYDTRAAAVSKPVFAADAEITTEFLSQERVIISYPAATVKAPEGFSDQIEHYYVELINTATGEVVDSYIQVTGFIYDDQPERYAGPYSVGFMGLSANTEYQIKVYAREFYQVSSDPLTLTFNTADGAAETNRGTATTAGATTTFSFTTGDYDYVSFEYKPTMTGTVSAILRSPGDIPYYGAFRFNAAGETEDYAGITTEIMDDGYILVTMKLSELGITNGKYNRNNAPATVAKLDIYQWSTADAYVDNVKAYDEEVIRGTATTAGTTSRFSYPLDKYDVIVFDYKLTSNQDKNGYIAVRLPSSGDVPYYGLFYLYNYGGNYEGVTCEQLDDGYIRVTIDLNKVNRTNSADNRNNVPNAIKAVDIHYYSTANAYIDNVHAYKAVVTEPTFTTGGYTTYTCAVCGDSYVGDETPAYTFGVSKWNIALCDDIRANFYLTIDSRLENASVAVYANGIIYNDGQDAMTSNSEGYYVISVNMAAAQMTDKITLELSIDGEIYETKTYSIRQYAEYILSGNYDDDTKLLVQRMLNYGAATQKYFAYKTGNLANAGYEMTDVPQIPEADSSSVASGTVNGISYYGSSLIYQTRIGVRFYFTVTGDISNYTFTDSEGNSYQPVKKSNLYFVEVMDVNPDEYDEVIVMNVTDGTDTMSVGYSPLRYISRKYYTATDAKLVALVGAMYQYHLAAERYISGK